MCLEFNDETKFDEAKKLHVDACRIVYGKLGANNVKCAICHLGQGKMLMKTNDVESSLEKFQEAFGLFENDENALEYLVETLYSIGVCYSWAYVRTGYKNIN